jgi:uncharacterized membrane protein YtjA (UPF0391 family)
MPRWAGVFLIVPTLATILGLAGLVVAAVGIANY